MAYFPDLSRYEYLSVGQEMVNVGWLGREGEIPTGAAVPDAVVEALLVWPIDEETLLRGVHDCEFCGEESPLRVPAPVERGYVSLGMGEFHVTGADGTVYSAPSLVVHYITAHGYRPPEVFLEAVGAGRH